MRMVVTNAFFHSDNTSRGFTEELECLDICVHVNNPKHWQPHNCLDTRNYSHTIVWTHETTATQLLGHTKLQPHNCLDTRNYSHTIVWTHETTATQLFGHTKQIRPTLGDVQVAAGELKTSTSAILSSL